MQEMNEMQTEKELQDCEKNMNGSIVKLITVVLMIMFFFPLCTVSCSGQTVDVNGVKATFGMDVLGQHIDGNLFCGLLFLIPCLILVIFCIKKMSIDYKHLLTLIGGIISAIILFVFKSKITNLAQEAYSEAKFTGCYYGEVIGNILLIILSLMGYMGLAILYGKKGVRIAKIKPEDGNANHSNDSVIAIIVAVVITCAVIVGVLLIGQHYALS